MQNKQMDHTYSKHTKPEPNEEAFLENQTWSTAVPVCMSACVHVAVFRRIILMKMSSPSPLFHFLYLSICQTAVNEMLMMNFKCHVSSSFSFVRELPEACVSGPKQKLNFDMKNEARHAFSTIWTCASNCTAIICTVCCKISVDVLLNNSRWI